LRLGSFAVVVVKDAEEVTIPDNPLSWSKRSSVRKSGIIDHPEPGRVWHRRRWMRRLIRPALSVRPKQPYLDWANTLEAGGVKIGQEFMPETSIYLAEDTTEPVPALCRLLEPD
jgi:hypothetical protein